MTFAIAAIYAQTVGLVFTFWMRSLWPITITSGICGLMIYAELTKP